MRTGHEVVAIDPAEQVVEVRVVETGAVSREPYDHLLIATGASPIRPPFPNIDAKGVRGSDVIPDAVALDDQIRDRSPRRAVVVGGGYIGLEMVEALQLRGLEVTLVEKLDQPMATLDADMGARVAEGLVAQGVDLRLGTGVQGFETDGEGWVRAVATDDGEISADLVVMGLGVRPNVTLAAEAGITIGPSGAIAPTRPAWPPRPPGVAAGDCAESRHRVTGAPAWIACWAPTPTSRGGWWGSTSRAWWPEFPGAIGTVVTKVGPVEIGRTGLTEREAAAAGLDAAGRSWRGPAGRTTTPTVPPWP